MGGDAKGQRSELIAGSSQSDASEVDIPKVIRESWSDIIGPGKLSAWAAVQNFRSSKQCIVSGPDEPCSVISS